MTGLIRSWLQGDLRDHCAIGPSLFERLSPRRGKAAVRGTVEFQSRQLGIYRQSGSPAGAAESDHHARNACCTFLFQVQSMAARVLEFTALNLCGGAFDGAVDHRVLRLRKAVMHGE